MWAQLSGVSHKEPLTNLTVHETQKPPWSIGAPKGWSECWTSQVAGSMCVCVLLETNVHCTASVQLPWRSPYFCPSRAVEREITKYGTMWTQAMIGWKTICGTASRTRERIRVSNPGVTGTRPQRFSRFSDRRGLKKSERERAVFFSVFLELFVFLWVYC